VRELILERKFSKDVEQIKRTGREMSRLAQAVDLLAEGKPMPPINPDHALVGNFKDYRKCPLAATGCCFASSPEKPLSSLARADTPTLSTFEKPGALLSFSRPQPLSLRLENRLLQR